MNYTFTTSSLGHQADYFHLYIAVTSLTICWLVQSESTGPSPEQISLKGQIRYHIYPQRLSVGLLCLFTPQPPHTHAHTHTHTKRYLRTHFRTRKVFKQPIRVEHWTMQSWDISHTLEAVKGGEWDQNNFSWLPDSLMRASHNLLDWEHTTRVTGETAHSFVYPPTSFWNC